MRILVCVKRVPAPGAKINVTEDGLAVDTAHLGFTTSPHEECALEEAVQITERDGGEVTVDGTIRSADCHTVSVLRSSEQTGEVCVHFPRVGYRVEPR